MDTLLLETNYTNHSLVRAKQRAGLNEKNAIKMIALAKERGIRADECRWSCDKRFLENHTDDDVEAVAYNGYCFIINKVTGRCITMYALPKNFGKKKTQYTSSRKDRSYITEFEWV